MLTPVDLQQKKFKQGMGYARKDVDSFFDIVVHSYTDLYKSNAELTNQVKTLTDTLVHYRTTESKLQKSLMLAEKNAEESAKNASDKARLIENDAKLQANSTFGRRQLLRQIGHFAGKGFAAPALQRLPVQQHFACGGRLMTAKHFQ